MTDSRYDRFPPYGTDPWEGLTDFQRGTTRFAPDEASRPVACDPPTESGDYWVRVAHWAEYAPLYGWHSEWAIYNIEVDPNTHEASFASEDRGNFPWEDECSVAVEVRGIVSPDESPVISPVKGVKPK